MALDKNDHWFACGRCLNGRENYLLSVLPCSTLIAAMWVNCGFDDNVAQTSDPPL